jgi:dimethylargininase
VSAFRRAIVRAPSRTFADGLTSSTLGRPDLDKARAQHATYCAALERCGLTLTHLSPDDAFPDSTFVEDPAILTSKLAILTRPGAPSRQGEVAGITAALPEFFDRIARIDAPGTVDGGDICQADDHFFIGLSDRTNDEGARQLAALLAQEGFTSSIIDIRASSRVLHLKTGMSYLGERRIVAMRELADHPAFRDYHVIEIAPEENYAANLLRINAFVILAAGFPKIAKTVADLGHTIVPLDMSEFRKMDGSLSCLSLRF